MKPGSGYLRHASGIPWEECIRMAILQLEIATRREPWPYTGQILSAFSSQRTHAAQSYIPYVLHPVEGDTYIWLNRQYKPLGMPGRQWIDFTQFPHAHVARTHPAVQRLAVWRGVDMTEPVSIYLYTDATAPRLHEMYASAALHLLCEIIAQPLKPVRKRHESR